MSGDGLPGPGVSLLSRSRDAVLRTVDSVGINYLVSRSGWRARRLLILCYHGFALRDEHLWDPELFVEPKTFRRRLEYLRKHRYNILRLGDALASLKNGALPPRSVVLTVDDGLFDFSARCYPLLQEFEAPASLYVSTYYVEHPWPVFNVMAGYLLWRGARQGRVTLPIELLGPGPHPIDTPDARARTTELLKRRTTQGGLSGEEKDQLLTQISAELEIDYAEIKASRILSLLRPAEIRALDSSLVDIQLHTHRHQTPEDRELFLKEIEDNRAALVRAGQPAGELVHLCYPSGVHRPAFLPWLRDAGIQSGTTCEPGLATVESEPLLLPRFIDTDRTTGAAFAAMASGLRGVLNRRALGV